MARSYQVVGGQVAVSGKKLKRSLKKRFIRSGLIILNMAVLFAVIFLVVKNPNSSGAVKQGALNQQSDSSVAANPLDELSSADIAVQVARLARLPETTAITNQADSQNEQLSIVAAGNQTVTKPQIVTTALKSKKDIKTYVTKSGDTVSAVATAFGVTSDSIKWSNGLSGDSLPVNKKLYIPPVSGIAYEVKQGDTVDSLTTKYRANKEQIIADNDAEVAGLKVGERVLIRDGSIPAPVAVAVSTGFAWGGASPVYGYNGYDYGFCTWYVANKRASLGRPLPANLGDAWTWDDNATRAGIAVGREPAVGAAIVTATGYRPGHVAIVEQLNEDGSVWISEMNSRGQASITDGSPAGGWGRVDFKLIPAAQRSSYNYIY